MSDDAHLDALIEEFRRGEFTHLGWYDEADVMAVERLRDKRFAANQCVTVSREFCEFLSEHNVKGRNVMLRRQQGDSSFEDHGYGDFPSGGHAISVVELPSGTYTVDWTASQYDYPEFPLVQKRGPAGWKRLAESRG